GCARDLESQRRLQFAFGQQLHAVPRAAQHAGLDQILGLHRRTGLQSALVDRALQYAEVDHGIALAESLAVEAALGKPAMQRRLAAFEAVEGDAGARGLDLAAAGAGLAFARADATTAPLGAIMGAAVILDLVEFHCAFTQLSQNARRSRNRAFTTPLRHAANASRARSFRALPAYPRQRASGDAC